MHANNASTAANNISSQRLMTCCIHMHVAWDKISSSRYSELVRGRFGSSAYCGLCFGFRFTTAFTGTHSAFELLCGENQHTASEFESVPDPACQ